MYTVLLCKTYCSNVVGSHRLRNECEHLSSQCVVNEFYITGKCSAYVTQSVWLDDDFPSINRSWHGFRVCLAAIQVGLGTRCHKPSQRGSNVENVSIWWRHHEHTSHESACGWDISVESDLGHNWFYKYVGNWVTYCRFSSDRLGHSDLNLKP